MTPVTRYQAADGTPREPIPPQTPPDQWGWQDRLDGGWAADEFGLILFASQEGAEMDLAGPGGHPDWIVAQYSARPPAPEDAR